jgi:hypothetical protein
MNGINMHDLKATVCVRRSVDMKETGEDVEYLYESLCDIMGGRILLSG